MKVRRVGYQGRQAVPGFGILEAGWNDLTKDQVKQLEEMGIELETQNKKSAPVDSKDTGADNADDGGES